MQITDKDLQQFRERAKTELQSNGAVGRLAWDTVVNALCNEVEELRKNAAPGNAAVMREALESCLDFIIRIDRAFNPFMQSLLENAVAKAEAALAAPPRNCDVSKDTAEERYLTKFGRPWTTQEDELAAWLFATADKGGGNG